MEIERLNEGGCLLKYMGTSPPVVVGAQLGSGEFTWCPKDEAHTSACKVGVEDGFLNIAISQVDVGRKQLTFAPLEAPLANSEIPMEDVPVFPGLEADHSMLLYVSPRGETLVHKGFTSAFAAPFEANGHLLVASNTLPVFIKYDSRHERHVIDCGPDVDCHVFLVVGDAMMDGKRKPKAIRVRAKKFDQVIDLPLQWFGKA